MRALTLAFLVLAVWLTPAGVGGEPNFGVDESRRSEAPKYHYRGHAVDRNAVFDLVEKGVPDDAAKLRLTVIGSPGDIAAVSKDWDSNPALAAYKSRVVFAAYDPSHWAVARAGFSTTGHPTIYCQAPDGKVLHRQEEYRGPDKLAEAIRKADPTYDPSKDPDKNKAAPTLPSFLTSLDLSQIPGWAVAACAFGLFLLLRNKV